jgi:hypothetical protein
MFGGYCGEQIRCECGDTALAGKIVAYKSDILYLRKFFHRFYIPDAAE